MNTQTLPFISIIIPVYNGEETMDDCLKSLIDQSYPKDKYEIIVIDNNSKDQTPEIIKKYPVKYLLEDKVFSSYTSRNIGIKESKGAVLAFIDADAKAHHDWLKLGAETILSENADYVGGNIIVFSDNKTLNCLDYYSLNYEFKTKEFMHWSNFAATCCLFIKKSAISQVGHFVSDLASGGDYEFGNRVSRAGLKQIYNQNIIAYHPARNTIKSLFKKWARVGGGGAELYFYEPEHYKKHIYNALNPINYLPPNPFNFKKSMDAQGIPFMKQRIGLYFLLFMEKIVRNYGCLSKFLSLYFKKKSNG